MRRFKTYPCKVGTVPWTVVLWGNFKPKVGRRLKFRDWHRNTKWHEGIVTQVHPDGFFFVDLMWSEL